MESDISTADERERLNRRQDVWKLAALFLDTYGMTVHTGVLKDPKYEPYFGTRD
jgi:hypothetical protein